MLLREPPATQADLHFRLGSVPVRVSPGFWLTSALLGFGGSQRAEPWELLVWIAAVFLSITIHELGHVWAMRAFGEVSHIVLYQFGGLAVPTARGHAPRRWAASWLGWRDLIVAAAGPGTQIAAAVVCMIALCVMGFGLPLFAAHVVPLSWCFPPIEHRGLHFLVSNFVAISIGWAVINLLPVLPLDGGVIGESLLLRWDRRNPRKHILIVSVATAAIVALYAFSHERLWTGVLFAALGYQNYQDLQQESNSGRGYSSGW